MYLAVTTRLPQKPPGSGSPPPSTTCRWLPWSPDVSAGACFAWQRRTWRVWVQCSAGPRNPCDFPLATTPLRQAPLERSHPVHLHARSHLCGAVLLLAPKHCISLRPRPGGCQLERVHGRPCWVFARPEASPEAGPRRSQRGRSQSARRGAAHALHPAPHAAAALRRLHAGRWRWIGSPRGEAVSSIFALPPRGAAVGPHHPSTCGLWACAARCCHGMAWSGPLRFTFSVVHSSILQISQRPTGRRREPCVSCRVPTKETFLRLERLTSGLCFWTGLALSSHSGPDSASPQRCSIEFNR